MRRLTSSFLAVPLAALLAASVGSAQDYRVIVDTSDEPVHEGRYEPSLESIGDYDCPEWFEDAKFGIWAHWGIQCVPGFGDWYARNMYTQGGDQYKYQLATMGHPSEHGFKDWIPLWKAENWEPDSLVAFYKDCGARYFMAMANHHDNFDNFDSKYQPWNSVNMGPHKDLIGGWAAAARKAGLPFGVSVHLAHAWTFMEYSRGSDSKGPLAGVPYDGWQTKEDGKGTWWEGYDIQDLYEQRHPLSKNSGEWNWNPELVTVPDQAYCDKVYNRVADLINKYDPQVLYFDDTFVPLWPVSDCGLKILAHYYNKSVAENGGKNMVVATGKVLDDRQKKALVWDVERGVPDDIQTLHWQTCTCIGSWHYDKRRYYEDTYKTPAQVISMLIDIVSKNGNLLLNIPVRGDGTIDPTERKIVGEIGAWLKVNGEGIYGTRPWMVFGEGPAAEKENALDGVGFNEGKVATTAEDVRFTKKGRDLYVFLLGKPEGEVLVRSLSKGGLMDGRILGVELLGGGKAEWRQAQDGLHIGCPADVPFSEAVCFKVSTSKAL